MITSLATIIYDGIDTINNNSTTQKFDFCSYSVICT